jgi:CDP-glucose 4,6-dehydratase
VEELVRESVLGSFSGLRVLVTGHTGFKGAWLSWTLARAGASVVGYSLDPPTSPNLFEQSRLSDHMASHIGDIRDLNSLDRVFRNSSPDVVFHLAAQPLVRRSYADPVGTYSTNVMGTVNVLECVRQCPSVRSVVNVTTDKVYLNQEWEWPYRENDALDGYDPYSNSKSCSELVTGAYSRSFLRDRGVAVSTARAGNVIGGGDYAQDRIIPDCVRAVQSGERILVRSPESTRPYQHVLDPVFAYLLIASAQLSNPLLAAEWNIGPSVDDVVATAKLVSYFCQAWGVGASWEVMAPQGPVVHEASRLALDSTRIAALLGWRPRWRTQAAVERVVRWAKDQARGIPARDLIDRDLREYMG